MYAYGNRLENSLSISAKVAKCKSYGSGIDTIKQIAVEHTLQKLSSSGVWNNVSGASWSKASNSRSVILSSSKSDLSIGTYRLKSVFTLTTKNGNTETITVYSSKETVK